MDIVGYRNAELVHQLTREGGLNTKYGDGTQPLTWLRLTSWNDSPW